MSFFQIRRKLPTGTENEGRIKCAAIAKKKDQKTVPSADCTDSFVAVKDAVRQGREREREIRRHSHWSFDQVKNEFESSAVKHRRLLEKHMARLPHN